jgi:hypothetical protein
MPVFLRGDYNVLSKNVTRDVSQSEIRVITQLPNSEQSYKGKDKTHNYINRQNQSTPENFATFIY